MSAFLLLMFVATPTLAQLHQTGVEYTLQLPPLTVDALRRRFDQRQQRILEMLNRTDTERLPKLDAVVVPTTWREDPLAYSPFPVDYEWGNNEAKLLIVDQTQQAFGAYERRRLVRWGPVGTGRRTHPTPAGLFHLNWRSPGRQARSILTGSCAGTSISRTSAGCHCTPTRCLAALPVMPVFVCSLATPAGSTNGVRPGRWTRAAGRFSIQARRYCSWAATTLVRHRHGVRTRGWISREFRPWCRTIAYRYDDDRTARRRAAGSGGDDANRLQPRDRWGSPFDVGLLLATAEGPRR